MKNKLIKTFITIILFFGTKAFYAQAPNLGSAANFVLYTSVGAVTNSGIGFLTKLTGNVGSNSAPTITGFGNINGQMHYVGDPGSAACQADLIIAYGQLNAAVPTFFPAPLIGNGATLNAGVYSITNATITLSGELILDGQGNPNAVFIFKLQGVFSSSTNARVKLINGAKACNVFWKVEGAVNMATGTTMRGTIVANNGAIDFAAGDTLEGRALSTNGAITTSKLLGYTPIGCGSPVLLGPAAPSLGAIACYATFTGIGANTNVGISNFKGDVGSNSGLTTGYNPLLVTGMIHPVPDGSTAAASSALGTAYAYLNGLAPGNIELLFPAQFGHNLVLTPHIYLMNGAVTFTDTLFLDAQGNANAVFAILVNGAFSTSVNSHVILINGAQAKNVYWKIDGAVTINDNSVFNGTIISAGAIDLKTGVVVNGRVLTSVGALNITAANVFITTSGLSTPSNKSICSGDTFKLILGASGTGNIYQWRKGNINISNGGHYSGVNSDTLVIFPFTSADTAYNYNVIATIQCSPKDTSDFIALKLNPATKITSEPMNQMACIGDTTKMFVKASGDSLTYQWRKGNINLINGLKYAGVNSDTLRINAFTILDTASNYNVIVKGLCTPNDTSINASLMPSAKPIISSMPTNKIACLGDTVKFTAMAAGNGISYQWRKGNINLINGIKYAGVNTDTLNIKSITLGDTASNYNVIAISKCGLNDTSINASLMLNAAPIITLEPINKIACPGDTVQFITAASGTNLMYQWRKGDTILINGLKYSGVNNDTLIINSVSINDTASNYHVIVTGICGLNDTSINTSLIVNTAPIITLEPINKIACSGDTVLFITTATGTGVTYQWRKGNTNLIDGLIFSGVNNDTLIIISATISDTAFIYNVIASGACNLKDTSINASLLINTAPIITADPTNQTACIGDSIQMIVKANGTGLNYQWRKGNINLINGLKYSGVNSDTLKISSFVFADTSSIFNVIVSGICFPNDTSINASLMNNSGPIITNEPSNIIACFGDSVSFNTVATGTGLTYQWRKGNVNLVNGLKYNGANSNSLRINSITALDTATNYNVIVSGTCTPGDTSIFATLSTNEAPIITLEPNNQVACAGDSVIFNTTANGTGLNFQWRKGNIDLVNSAKISGANSNKLTVRSLNTTDTASNYNVIVTGTCLLKDTSINASLIVNQKPIINAEPSNQTVCAKSSANFTVSATGTNLTYQWKKGNAIIVNSANVSGATTSSLLISNTSISDTGTNYHVIVSGTCLPSDTSIFASLTINQAPNIATESADKTICLNNATSFSVNATGTNLTYQWRKGNTNILASANISGVNTSTLTFNQVSTVDTGSDYNVIVTGLCAPNDTSRNTYLKLSTAPAITTEPINQAVCEKDSVVFTVNASGTNLNYQWRKGNVNLTNGASVSGANSSSLTIRFIALSDTAFNYNVIVSGDCVPQDTSNNASLIVNPTPVALALSNSPICTDSSIILTANAIAGSTYDWTGPNNYTSTNQVSIITAAKAVNAGNYTLVITSNNCKSQPSIVSVVVNDCPQTAFFIPEGFSPNGDGINDVFFIRGLNAYPNNSIEIFNRWGEKVYEANPYLNDWNGSCNIGLRIGGTELPVGTYFYVFSKGDNSPIITGTIYLNN